MPTEIGSIPGPHRDRPSPPPCTASPAPRCSLWPGSGHPAAHVQRPAAGHGQLYGRHIRLAGPLAPPVYGLLAPSLLPATAPCWPPRQHGHRPLQRAPPATPPSAPRWLENDCSWLRQPMSLGPAPHPTHSMGHDLVNVASTDLTTSIWRHCTLVVSHWEIEQARQCSADLRMRCENTQYSNKCSGSASRAHRVDGAPKGQRRHCLSKRHARLCAGQSSLLHASLQ